MTDLETAAVGCRSCGEMGFILAPTKAEPNIERQFLCPTCAHTAEKIRAAREAERERCLDVCRSHLHKHKGWLNVTINQIILALEEPTP